MQTDVRDAIVTAVSGPFEAAFPGVAIVYNNGPFDWNNPPAEFVEFEVEFYAGKQIGMSSTPKTRLSGYVYVSARKRDGTGHRTALQTLDWFSATLGYAILGRIQFQAPDPDGTATPPGWYIERLKIAFFADPT